MIDRFNYEPAYGPATVTQADGTCSVGTSRQTRANVERNATGKAGSRTCESRRKLPGELCVRMARAKRRAGIITESRSRENDEAQGGMRWAGSPRRN
ncbi:hypothetical protein R1flu_019208 [Riccia fluitans]|uniref:Uncharacterized protein n=1 Tax=Riccia fluitans TaxID=41844 RepID=A0ABD1ZJI1_9MARC